MPYLDVQFQKYAPILEPFCNGPKTEVALINVVQVYCYEDTRIMKAFPQILKVRSVIIVASHLVDVSTYQVLYSTDCISDQAIIYWHQKGSKPNGRQHFLKTTESLVKVLLQTIETATFSLTSSVQFLQEHDDSEEEDE